MMNSKNVKEEGKSKPFFRGALTDENTVKKALGFFVMLLLIAFMTFLVCSMTGFGSNVLRILINLAIEAVVLFICFTKGADLGTDAVARGEILWQHEQKGIDIAPSEKRIPYNPGKGFLIGFAGSALFFILAVLLSVSAQKQMTGSGTLPSWMEAYMQRSEISDALVSYLQPASFSFQDFLRVGVRIVLMPFISMAGAENKDAILLIERLSPLLVLLPAIAYGIGYLQGPSRRKQIHTEIARNIRKRQIREKKRKHASVPKGPQKLN